MQLRAYCPADCPMLAQLFYETVHTVNARDYTQAQLNAWADGLVDLEDWNRSFLEHITVVAQVSGHIAGFGDMTCTGYLDRLYVHWQMQSMGIGTAICNYLEQTAGDFAIQTHASITARPFFEGRGYQALLEEQVTRRGVLLKRSWMVKTRGGLIDCERDQVLWKHCGREPGLL